MSRRPRPRRVAIAGARVQVASTVADLMNVSRTAVLLRLGSALRPGSEWPLVLELPEAPVRLVGRVVRCEPMEVSLPGGTALHGQYALALTFVNPSPEAQTALDQICGTAVEADERRR